MYEIELSDGTTLKNLRISGNHFFSEKEVTPETFAGKLSRVKIRTTDENPVIQPGEYVNLKLTACTKMDAPGIKPGYYFVLQEIPEEEIQREKVRADIDYIAMMKDIDLES